MHAVAVDASGTTLLHTHDEVRRRLAGGSFVWVDLECGAEDLGEHELADRLGLDLPRLGWLGRFDQPARVEVRDELAEIIVPFADGDSVVNVHVVASVKPLFLLTVHREAVPALDALRSSAGPRMGLQGHVALYLLLDAAKASFKRALAAVGQDLEDLQERVAPVPATQQLLGSPRCASGSRGCIAGSVPTPTRWTRSSPNCRRATTSPRRASVSSTPSPPTSRR